MTRSRHPHILKICSDQHSPLVCGFAGDPVVRTPNLDRLAERGTVFDNHYCASPICVPGRYSMITGRLPRELNRYYLQSVLPLETPTYMRHFAQHGYQTTCVGKMHFHGPEQMHGWMFRPYGDMQAFHGHIPGYDPSKDVSRDWPTPRTVNYDDDGGYTPWMLKHAGPGDTGFARFDRSVTRESVENLTDYFTPSFIDEMYQADRPLLFEVSFKGPHCPFVAPEEYFEQYRGRIGLPRTEMPGDVPPMMRRRMEQDEPPDITDAMRVTAREGYWALVQFLDDQIGAVVDTLETLGVLDDFVIMYTSDHGEMVGERGLWQKQVMYEPSVRVPMLLAGPGIPAGRRVRENTSHLDLFATMCDLANLPQPDAPLGRSMRPLWTDDTTGQRTVLSEFFSAPKHGHSLTDDGSFTRLEMAKRGGMKLVRYSDGDTELFDVDHDPDELHNLTDDPAHAPIRHELIRALDALGDPDFHADPLTARLV